MLVLTAHRGNCVKLSYDGVDCFIKAEGIGNGKCKLYFDAPPEVHIQMGKDAKPLTEVLRDWTLRDVN